MATASPSKASRAAVASRLRSTSSCSAVGREAATGMESSGTGDVLVPAATKTLRVQCTKAKWAWNWRVSGLFARHRVTKSVSYTHLRAHETRHDLVCRLLLEK